MKRLLLLFVITSLVACQKTPQESSQNQLSKKPFIHTAYFWINKDASAQELTAFYKSTEKLKEIEAVQALYSGVPANTTRATVEKTYDFAVVVHFKDLAAHDAYQKHPIHQQLLADYAYLWERVMVTDIE
jgi:hypothetical protein